MRDQKIIREKVKKVLKFRGLTQRDLADMLAEKTGDNVFSNNPHYLRRILGEGKIQKERFDEIAKILDIHPGYLSGEVDKIHNIYNYRQISEEGDYELIDENEQYVLIDDLLENKEYYEKKYDRNLYHYISYRAHNSMDFIEIINILTKTLVGITITEEKPVYTREDYENILYKMKDMIRHSYHETVFKRGKIPIERNPPYYSLPDDSPFYKK